MKNIRTISPVSMVVVAEEAEEDIMFLLILVFFIFIFVSEIFQRPPVLLAY
jgi:hypothetical protein